METLEDTYTVKRGDTVWAIGRSHGYKNPGPLVAYPRNHAVFPTTASANLIHPGQLLAIPWHPDLLRKVIATSQALIQDVTTSTTKIIQKQLHDKEELEDYLRKIDAINMIAQVQVAMGAVIVEGMEHGASLSSREIAAWLAATGVHTFAGDLAPLVIPSPSAPKKDFKFYVRHSLGPWTPSYWTSVYMAIKEGDVDIYLYGSDAVTYKAAMELKAHAESDIARLNKKVGIARGQLGMRWYRAKI